MTKFVVFIIVLVSLFGFALLNAMQNYNNNLLPKCIKACGDDSVALCKPEVVVCSRGTYEVQLSATKWRKRNSSGGSRIDPGWISAVVVDGNLDERSRTLWTALKVTCGPLGGEIFCTVQQKLQNGNKMSLHEYDIHCRCMVCCSSQRRFDDITKLIETRTGSMLVYICRLLWTLFFKKLWSTHHTLDIDWLWQ